MKDKYVEPLVEVLELGAYAPVCSSDGVEGQFDGLHDDNFSW